MRTAWLNLVAVGSVTTLIATACVIKTGDGDEDTETGGRSNRGGSSSETGGRGGVASGGRGGTGTGGTTTSTTGGTSAGGSTSGGASARGGATATGGTSATGGGGAKATPYCDGTGPASDPAPSCAYDDTDLNSNNGTCLSCLTQSCCSHVRNCHGTDPSGEVVVNQCGADGTEYRCYQSCLKARAAANGGFYDSDADPLDCADECVRDGCSTIGDFTSDMISCMHMNCEEACLEL